MNIAASSLVYSQGSIDESLDMISKMGFTHVDLGALQGWCHIQPQALVKNFQKEASEVKKLLKQYELTPIALNAGIDEPYLEQWEALVRLAAELGVGVITIGAQKKDVYFTNEVERLTILNQISSSSRVQLTIETHAGTLTELPEQALRLVQAVPGLGLTLDISHYYCNETEDQVEVLLPYVRHVHFRDCGRTWEQIQLPFGEGILDLNLWISLLKKHRYEGNITVEYIDLPDVQF